MTLDHVRRAQHALRRLGRHAVDAHHELDARMKGDGDAVGRALELLDSIDQDLGIVRAIVLRLPIENEPWERL
jgi:hypothetical protein